MDASASCNYRASHVFFVWYTCTCRQAHTYTPSLHTCAHSEASGCMQRFVTYVANVQGRDMQCMHKAACILITCTVHDDWSEGLYLCIVCTYMYICIPVIPPPPFLFIINSIKTRGVYSTHLLRVVFFQELTGAYFPGNLYSIYAHTCIGTYV